MALFGIKRIQYCKATTLAFSGQNNPFLGIASEPTNTFTDVVCMINSRATLTIEQAVVNKQIVYTAKLQFVTPTDPMLDVDHYAFIATTNEGERILLGANTRPQVAVVTAQGVFGTSGELTAYTTTAEFKADYRPLRLPVTAAEPISGPAYDICCGQIIGQEPTPEPTLLTVIWQNYDGTQLDSKTYYSNQPEPTTTVVPTRQNNAIYTYTFSSWAVYSQTATTKIYRAQFTAFTWRNEDPEIDLLTIAIPIDSGKNSAFVGWSYNGIVWQIETFSGNPATKEIQSPNALVVGQISQPDLLANSFDFVSTAVFDLIYDTSTPPLAIGYKYQNTPVPSWTKNYDYLDHHWAVIFLTDESLYDSNLSFWLFVSFNGTTIQQMPINVKGRSTWLYFDQQPVYFKAIGYNLDGGYEAYDAPAQQLTVEQITDDHNVQIGFYTDDWHGEPY